MAQKKNLFEMGANFGDGWNSDNKSGAKKSSVELCSEHLAPKKHQLHFAKEKRRGKVVTIVKPFCVEKEELKRVLKSLKKRLGTGGAIKDNTLELQGELQDMLRVELDSLGYRFK